MIFQISDFETRSLPALPRSYPRHFAFYVAHPVRSILFILSEEFVFSELAFAAATLPPIRVIRDIRG